MGVNSKAFLSISVLLLAPISFGTITSFPSIGIMSLTEKYPQLSEERFKNLISWFTDAARLSAGVGPFLIIPILPKFGRKIMLSISSFLIACCWFLILTINMKDKSRNVPFNLVNAIITRTILGLFWGCMCCIALVYITELSPPDSYGIFCSCYQLFIILGICLNNIIGAFVDYKTLIIIDSMINVLLGIAVIFIKDSPVSKKLKSRKICKFCDTSENGTHNFVHSKSFYKTVLSSFAMLIFQQYCGINAILNNLSTIMSMSGLNLNPNLQSALSTMAQFLACLIACFLMDSVGIRILWIVSSLGCLLSLVVYSYCIYSSENLASVRGYIPALSVFVYCLFFGLGQGPAPWVLFPQSYSDELRFEGVTLTYFSHWIVSFIVCFTHPILQKKVGEFYVILIYMIFAVGSIFYGFFFIPKKSNVPKEDFAML